MTSCSNQNRESNEGCSKLIVRKKLQVREKNWSQQVEHLQVPFGTGPGVRRSKRPLSACYNRRKCSNLSHLGIIGQIYYSRQ